MKSMFSILPVLAAVAITAPSKADIITDMITGVVGNQNPVFSNNSTIDTFGLFGDPGTDLRGKAFSLTYLFDTSKGLTQNDSSVTTIRYGFIPDSPSLGANLTINNHVFSLVSYTGEIQNYNQSSIGYNNSGVFRQSQNSSILRTNLFGANNQVPVEIDSSFGLDLTQENSFAALRYFGNQGNEDITLTPTSFVQVDTSLVDVPEPTTLAVLALGTVALIAFRRKPAYI